MTDIRWGILGTGYVARNFADGLRLARGCTLRAVASRDPDKAREFAVAHGESVRSYGDYAALAADPEVDVVYVATPNEYHVEHSLLAIEAGKAVLCEKPMALSREEAARIFDAAIQRDVFCMEGMWMRCSPALQRVLEEIRDGAIGQPRLLASQLGFPNVASPESRLFKRPGGGALLDLGVYLVSLAHAVFGMPSDISARAVTGVGGVDEQVSMLLSFGDDRQATLTASITSLMRNDTSIHGTLGILNVDAPVYFPQSFSIQQARPQSLGSQAARRPRLAQIRQIAVLQPVLESLRALKAQIRTNKVRLAPHGTGMTAEAEEVARCLRAGLRESPLIRAQDTLDVMQILDAVRHNWTHI